MSPRPSSPTTSDPVEWYPARILRGHRPEASCHDEDQRQKETATPFALVVLNQPLKDVPTLKRLWDNSNWRLAADGGANRLLDVIRGQEDGRHIERTRQRQDEKQEMNGGGNGDSEEACHLLETNNLDIIIGDLDSLSSEARTYFSHPANNAHLKNKKPTEIIHNPDQESTDFGKAITHIRTGSPSSSSSTKPPSPPLDIVVLGGLGGRVDQGLSQLHHLYLFQQDPDYQAGRLLLVSGSSLTFLLKANVGAGSGRVHRIHVREQGQEKGQEEELFDKYVGIIPIREPSVITTRGLEWDVTDWETEFGGRMSTSNHVLPDTQVVEVETTKDVLFTIALRKSE